MTSWLCGLAAEGRIDAGAYFGSYARGDAGVGSDLDVVLVVTEDRLPFESRAVGFDTTGLPVPVDLVVYTRSEFESVRRSGSRFARVLSSEAVWVVGPP